MIGATTARQNPFPGLRTFEADQEELFFGRERHVDELLGRLKRSRFIAVVGTSGSGKSSLVRAGLIPRLYGGSMAGVGSRWRVALMRPGNAPLSELANAFEQIGMLGAGGDAQMRKGLACATLERGALGLVELAEHGDLEADENVLLVVDQFEELFRFTQRGAPDAAADDAATFVRLLVTAASDAAARIYVLITIRSDFLGNAARFRDLPEAINDGFYLVPRLRRDELRAAIVGPLGVVHTEITPRLVNQLLNDVGDDPDQLPVLQHALMRTWDMWECDAAPGTPIDLVHYRATGGLERALSLHGNEIVAELSARGRVVCERLFKALTDRRGVRSSVRVSDACAIADASFEEIAEVADAFRKDERSFLMPPQTKPLAPDVVLDLTHESLIRTWDTLRGWVAQEARSAQVYHRLVYLATKAWSNAVEDASYQPIESGKVDPVLLHGTELAIAVRWRSENRPNAAWARRYSDEGVFDTVMRFIDCSLTAQQISAKQRIKTDRIVKGALATIVAAAAGLLIVGAIAVRSSAPAVLLFALAGIGLACASCGVALLRKRRAPAAGVAALLIGAGVYVYGIATCVTFVSEHLTESLVADAGFRQWVGVLPPPARLKIEAGAITALKAEYSTVVGKDRPRWTRGDFHFVIALLNFLQEYNGPANGHVLFYQSQIEHVVHKRESPVWRIAHTSTYDTWTTYLRNLPKIAAVNPLDLKQCWKIEGFCNERAAWIYYIRSFVEWQASQEPAPHDPDGRPIAVTAFDRVRFLKAAQADLVRSLQYYPKCVWLYQPPAELMNDVVSALRKQHAELPLAPPGHIACEEPRHDPFTDFVPAY